jgi:hypothetical protein
MVRFLAGWWVDAASLLLWPDWGGLSMEGWGGWFQIGGGLVTLGYLTGRGLLLLLLLLLTE